MLIVGRVSGVKDLLTHPLGEIADAARAAVRSAAEALQADLRGQVRAAGLGNGLEKAWRLQVYPHGRTRSFRPAGLVWSKATRLHDAFERGQPVTAKGGRWLAIPLPAATAAGLDRSPRRGDRSAGGALPAKWSAIAAAAERFGPLRFVPVTGGARALLVADGKVRGDRLGRGGKGGRAASVPLFLLVRRARGRKLLDIAGAAQLAEARLAQNLSNLLGRA